MVCLEAAHSSKEDFLTPLRLDGLSTAKPSPAWVACFSVCVHLVDGLSLSLSERQHMHAHQWGKRQRE